ncbi:hypothetical protein [Saccharopolyspora cebuensis]|uniref:Excreted virulence factor EspC, type VII ESX diderm n=1 Tax=Saccharopolyspora cebuensis TaxID=418759 RepID=A0ABV4CQP8_9PSEU
MSFSYEYKGLQQVADFFDQLADDVMDARTWLSDTTDMTFGPGLLNLVLGGHNDVTETVTDHQKGFSESVLRVAAEEFRAADKLYRSTDDEASKEIDQAWQDADVGTAPEAVPGAGAGPTFMLVTRAKDFTTNFGDFDGEFTNEPKWSFSLSATDYSRKIVYEASQIAVEAGVLSDPVDLYEYLLKPVFGNWVGLRQCAEVYDILSKQYEEYSAKIAEGVAELDSIWTGAAADGAKAWMVRLSHYCTDVAADLSDISKEYKDGSKHCYDLAQAVGPPAIQAVEHAVLTSLAAGYAAGTTATIVGAPAGAVLGAAAVAEAVLFGKAFATAISAVGNLKTAVDAFGPTLGGMGVVTPANLRLGGGADTEVPDMPDLVNTEHVGQD